MNIDLATLDRAGVSCGPTIAITDAGGGRLVTLSPYAVPLEQGIALLKTPSNELCFYGVSVCRLALGIPQYVVEYLATRIRKEHDPHWQLVGYGLVLSVTRQGDYWLTSLGNTPICRFQYDVRLGTSITGLELLGSLTVHQTPVFLSSLQALLPRYL